MNTVQEYVKRGGSQGIALEYLNAEFAKALSDKSHLLNPAIKALKNGHFEKAFNLLIKILIKALDDKSSALYMPALFLIKMPFLGLAIKKEEEAIRNGKCKNMLTAWAAMGIQKEEMELEEKNLKSTRGKKAADARYSKPGGTRDKHKKIKEEWRSGKYKTKDECAESIQQKYSLSFSTVRKILRNL